MKITLEYDKALENLQTNIIKKFNNWMPDHYRKITTHVVSGYKFDKIVKDNSVWGFVVKNDGVFKGTVVKKGDVLLAANWRAPAKHVRGSIFDSNTDWYSWTSPEYLFTRKARLADVEVDS
jgi:hypothetical protein